MPGWLASKAPRITMGCLGYTNFLGPNRNELGFQHFFEGGLALESDVSRRNWALRKLRLRAKGIYGKDVTGRSLIFGYRF
jgi:hypothetical protein